MSLTITFLLIKHEILHMVTYDVCEKKGTIPQKLHRDAKLIKIQNSFFLYDDGWIEQLRLKCVSEWI